MDELSFIIRPGDNAGEERIGGKAAALSRLGVSVWGSMIPPWFSLTGDAFLHSLEAAGAKAGKAPSRRGAGKKTPVACENSASPLTGGVEKALKKAVRQLAGEAPPRSLFAVRSSAVGEDGAAASYAGQLSSELNVPGKDVAKAVRRVWESAMREHVAEYREKVGEGGAGALLPAVLVQVMVPADVAGVGFSVDPVSGNSGRMVISACAGLGDKLVSGEVNGDTYYCTRQGDESLRSRAPARRRHAGPHLRNAARA